MEIIKPSYEILTRLKTEDSIRILQMIESAGRVCYKSEAKNEDNDIRITEKFVQGLIKKGHESVIEHQSISIKVICDRGVSHEVVRHRLCSYSQESTRYCNYTKKGMQFILPPWVDERLLGEYNSQEDVFNIAGFDTGVDHCDLGWLETMYNISHIYNALNENGWNPQKSRSVLPNSLKTEIVITANLRQWREIFRQRCSHFAHPQMQEIMHQVLSEFNHFLPEIFEDIHELIFNKKEKEDGNKEEESTK